MFLLEYDLLHFLHLKPDLYIAGLHKMQTWAKNATVSNQTIFHQLLLQIWTYKLKPEGPFRISGS